MVSDSDEREAAAPPAGGLAGRAVWTTLDQAVSSVASAALSIVVARTASVEEFGTFALAFSMYAFLIGISQAVGGQILVIRFTGAASRSRHRAVGLASGNAVVLGIGAAGASLCLLALVPLPAASVAVTVALFMPVLLLQDAWRTVLISSGKPRAAFLNDLAWTGLQLAIITVLIARAESEALWYVLAWAGSAAVAAALGVRQAGRWPVLVGGLAWAWEHRDLAGYLLAQWVAVLGTTQLAFVLLAVVDGVEPVGSLRAAQTLLGPLNVIGMAVTSFAVPELVRARPGRAGLIRAVAALSGFMLLVNLVWGGILLLLSDGAGEQLLGETWSSAREALPGMILFTCAIGVTTGPALLFRALDTTRYVFWTGAVLGPLILVLSVVGQVLHGVQGAAYGFALSGLAVVPLSFWLAARSMREVTSPSTV